MAWINKYARVEEESTVPELRASVPKKRDREPPVRRRAPNLTLNRLSFQGINTVFKEPIYNMLHKIKKEPLFKWPPKMQGELSSRDSTSRCSYHRDAGHLTEDCRVYKSFLEKLVQEGHLEEFIDKSSRGFAKEGADVS